MIAEDAASRSPPGTSNWRAKRAVGTKCANDSASSAQTKQGMWAFVIARAGLSRMCWISGLSVLESYKWVTIVDDGRSVDDGCDRTMDVSECQNRAMTSAAAVH